MVGGQGGRHGGGEGGPCLLTGHSEAVQVTPTLTGLPRLFLLLRRSPLTLSHQILSSLNIHDNGVVQAIF